MARPHGQMYDPIPADGRLVRSFRRYEEKVAHAKLLAQLVLETGGNVGEERKRVSGQHTAADGLTLRGLPAVSRGVAGAIRGTNPEGAAIARDEQRREVVVALRQDGHSQRAIAGAIGVSKRTIAKDLQGQLGTGTQLPDRVTSLDGKSRPASRPKAEPEPVNGRPEARASEPRRPCRRADVSAAGSTPTRG